jgi:hypothetical protein
VTKNKADLSDTENGKLKNYVFPPTVIATDNTVDYYKIPKESNIYELVYIDSCYKNYSAPEMNDELVV